MTIERGKGGRFSPGQSGNPTGRPRGAKGKRLQLPAELTSDAIAALAEAVAGGDVQAIRLVLDRTIPALKAVTPESSLDGELMALKIRELAEFEQRLAAIEAGLADKGGVRE